MKAITILIEYVATFQTIHNDNIEIAKPPNYEPGSGTGLCQMNYFHEVAPMKEINSDIDFADSAYKSCELSNTQLKLTINSWDNKKIEIIFSNTILLHSYGVLLLRFDAPALA